MRTSIKTHGTSWSEEKFLVACVDFSQEHLDLIESIVRKNPRFSGNEDLFEDFCSETCNRSYSILTTVNDVDNLTIYLNKIVSSAILNVLKNSGRLKRTKTNYEKVQEIPISLTQYNVDDNGEMVFDIPDPALPVDEKISRQEEIKLIRNIICKINMDEPEKQYFEIFKSRYFSMLKQSEIAYNLNISQGEVSKRLTELAIKVNSYLKNI